MIKLIFDDRYISCLTNILIASVTFYLTFYLAFFLTVYLEFYLTFYLAFLRLLSMVLFPYSWEYPPYKPLFSHEIPFSWPNSRVFALLSLN